VIASGLEIGVSDLPPRVQTASESPNAEDLSLQDAERCAIAKALKKVNFNKAAAARVLGVNIQRLNRRIVRLGIRMPDQR
jgi:transcriptional regulator with GAF, ATPase, and Fis domain